MGNAKFTLGISQDKALEIFENLHYVMTGHTEYHRKEYAVGGFGSIDDVWWKIRCWLILSMNNAVIEEREDDEYEYGHLRLAVLRLEGKEDGND